MKRLFLILITVGVFATTLATNALGQTAKTVKANVKFDFHIGERLYPAGEYQIESISSMNENMLQIRSAGNTNYNDILIANRSNAGKRQEPILVFQKYGENYFLTEIFLGTECGYSIRPSRRQRENEKHVALASFEKD